MQADVDEAERLVDALRRGVAELPYVAAVFLFGSRVTGRARSDSDIDVALLLDRSALHRDRLSVLREVVAALGGHVAADKLDVVLLDDAPPALGFQVLRHGRLIECRDVVALHRFRVRTYRLHADFEPVERLMRRAARERAAKATSHG